MLPVLKNPVAEDATPARATQPQAEARRQDRAQLEQATLDQPLAEEDDVALSPARLMFSAVVNFMILGPGMENRRGSNFVIPHDTS